MSTSAMALIGFDFHYSGRMSRLLPDSDEKEYESFSEASKSSEGLVNGLWNTYQHFLV
jgi:hypothetical protein